MTEDELLTEVSQTGQIESQEWPRLRTHILRRLEDVRLFDFHIHKLTVCYRICSVALKITEMPPSLRLRRAGILPLSSN